MSSRSRRKRQSRLIFSPLPDSSPARAAQPEAVRNRVAAVVVDGTGSPLSSKRWQTRLSPLPTPVASSAAVAGAAVVADGHATRSATRSKSKSFMHRAGATGRIPSSSMSMRSSPLASDAAQLRSSLRDRFPDDSDSDGPIAPSSTRKTLKRGRPEPTADAGQAESSDDSVPNPRASKRPRSTLTISDDNEESGDDDAEDDDVPPSTPYNMRRKKVHDMTSPPTPDSDSDQVINSSARRPRRLRQKKKRLPSSEDEAAIVASEQPESDAEQSESDAELSDTQVTPQRRSSIELADLKEDLDFLAPSDDGDTPRASKQQSEKKTAKQKALDLLRRRRQQSSAGLSSDAPAPASDGEQDGDRQDFPVGEDDDDDEVDDEGDGNIYDALEDNDGADQDWIVDEGDDDEQVEIPAEFRLRTAKPKQLFRIVVEWCVQKKINPGFDSGDSAFEIAFARLSTFVTGLGGSKYHSSAWTPVFSRGLRARPVLQEEHTPTATLMHDRCDACNRSGHPASFEVRFAGSPYDRDSLEDFSDDDDGTGQETAIPDADRVFYIGKTCMRNARVAHQLHHWRYHLNSWIVDYLDEHGHLAPAKIVKRDGQSTRKRGKAAAKIVQRMEDAGEIKALYRDFKNEIDRAQSGEGSGATSSFAYDSD